MASPSIPPWLAWRDLTANLVAKEIKLRYMGAALGFIWSLGNPLVVTLTYYFVFTYIFPGSEDRFALHLVTGVFHWMLLAQILPQSCDWLINNANLIRKIRFPRILLAMSGVMTVCVFWLAALLVYLALFKLLGGEFTLAMLWYPPAILLYLAFITGIGLTLSIVQVTFRDMRHIVDVVLPLLFWLTPIVWTVRALPPEAAAYLSLNPLVPYFRIFDAILHAGTAPAQGDLILASVFATASLLVGLLTFRRSADLVELL